jgi:hypothetical protein
MAMVDLCCLANSRKLQGRCVAGIDFVGKRWIRPVSRLEFRILTYRHYQLPPPLWETKVLDQVRIPLEKPCPECHHPEDCYVGGAPWKLLHRPATPEELHQLHDRLEPFLTQDEYLFGTPEDRIPHETFKSAPAAASLVLARVEQLWCRTVDHEGKRKNRVHFFYNGHPYNLSLTDPAWEQQLALLPPASYPAAKLDIPAGAEIWMTFSLGEPYQGECYKLAATVMVW